MAIDPFPAGVERSPTPFTAEEIRAGCPEGRVVVTRSVVNGVAGEAIHRTEFGKHTADGVELSAAPAGSRLVTWSDLQAHASFPAEATTVTREYLTTALGRWECLRYDVRLPDREESLWFAIAKPGMPIRTEARRADGSVSVTEVIESWLPPRAVTLRYPVLEDAADMADVHVAAWQSAYRGIMSDAFLDDLRPEDRVAGWEEQIARVAVEDRPGRALVAEVDGRVVAICGVGPASDEDRDDYPSGQLRMLNAHPDVFGTGVSGQLHDFGMRLLRALGHTSAYLWVARDNPRARRFYERQGWTADGVERLDPVGGAMVPEVRYVRLL